METKHGAAHAHHGHLHAQHAGSATDPVCGMQVDPQSAAGSHEHAGVKYYFCSRHCLAQFQADPAWNCARQCRLQK